MPKNRVMKGADAGQRPFAHIAEACGGYTVTELAFPAGTAVRLARLCLTTGLKLPNCCVVLAAEDAGASITSFDERLTKCAEMRNLTVARS